MNGLAKPLATARAATLFGGNGASMRALPPALDGERHEISTPGAGRVSWYQDSPTEAAADARPLLLLHSVNAAGSAYEVKPLYDHYRRNRPVIAPDLPGFGFSERSRRLYTPRLMTDAVHELVARVRSEYGGGAVDAIALSLSAEFLARAAVESPQSFRSLGFVSPTGFDRRAPRLGPNGSTLGRPLLHAIVGAPGLGRGLFGLLTRRGVIRYFLGRTWGGPGIDDGLLDYDEILACQPGAEHAPLCFLCGYLFSGDSGALYRALAAPVWVVHGVRGDFVDYTGLAQFSATPNWTIDVLPTGALPHFERLPEFVLRYDAWCARVDRQE
jgi:pimeloyl-ACP methyl ester carboxylesterase